MIPFYTITTLFFKDRWNVNEISHDETDINFLKEITLKNVQFPNYSDILRHPFLQSLRA
jgi:hypothetical protein